MIDEESTKEEVLEAVNFTKNMEHPIGKPWDYVFSKLEPYWVIITLTGGKKIAGKYSYKSFTSSAPHDEQIYLEETWVLDEEDAFLMPRKGTRGILITSKEIETIEFFDI